MFGNYKLPKHCDNNEVLKALCNEAGWTVEPEGTTYRKGCKPVDRLDFLGGSTLASPCSSYHPSPGISYNPSPASSSFPSPASSPYTDNLNGDSSSLIPWLKNLSYSSSSSSSSKFQHLYFAGSISAPVTPPLSSPTARTPWMKTDLENSSARASWGSHCPYLPLSTPPSPGRKAFPDSGMQMPQGRPTSPTFSLVSSDPFGFKFESMRQGSSSLCNSGQSGTCSPALPASSDVPMTEVISDEFAFGSIKGGLVKPWEGERIHEDCSDDLELTLGSLKTRYWTCWHHVEFYYLEMFPTL